VKLTESEYLKHYGILRRSGRYPWGSGANATKRSKSFLDIVNQHRQEGLSEAKIAELYSSPKHPFTTTDLRALKTIAINELRQQKVNQVVRLKEKGLSNVAIGERMSLNESSVRSLLAAHEKESKDILQSTSDMLKRQVDTKGAIDIGTGVERSLPLSDNPAANIGISSTKFNTAVAMLKEQGYVTHTVNVKQIGTGKFTTVKVLARKDVQWKDLVNDPSLIKPITEHSDNGGRHWDGGFQPPIDISSKRIGIRYAEDGGAKADGVIYVRPGKEDISLGRSNYAQVRISVDGTHYLKGMAVYKDDLPAGTDLLFNTNKSKVGNSKHDVMKKQADDTENPFGAVTRQLIGEDGRVKSAMNIVNEEGDWDKWSRSLPTQMLSKQRPDVAQKQLDVTFDRRRRELNAINELTNPVIRRRLLETFGDETDSAAVHLKAAAMPRQATKVILPISKIKENEIYCPSLPDGEKVALVRFPHGGTFEIPQVTVNNKNPEARKVLGSSARDAIGIHHSVAERLSGADFDGDSVLAIPNRSGSIKSTPPLERLKGFDPRSDYKAYDGMTTIDGGTWNAKTREVEYHGKPPNRSNMQHKMGDVSNLITDMTIQGANSEDLARAVRHSMVVIDSEKHSLDYKSSYRDHGIAQLKEKYQGRGATGRLAGASTLISRASQQTHLPERRPRRASEGGAIDPQTGAKVFVPTGRSYVNRQGQTILIKERHARLEVTPDAHTLISKTPTPIENVYADHSNRLKNLANAARLDSLKAGNLEYSPSARKVYAHEVDSLNAKLNVALKNAPLERRAQSLANSIVSQTKAANPGMDKDDLRKVQFRALAEARARTGAGKKRIGSPGYEITPREWQAIQAGAISTKKLNDIIDNGDIDAIRRLATPRTKLVMTSTKRARADQMLADGYTLAEVADQLGVALSTLKSSVYGQ
jgi:DNA-binding NarL/FixJ family response regulator